MAVRFIVEKQRLQVWDLYVEVPNLFFKVLDLLLGPLLSSETLL